MRTSKPIATISYNTPKFLKFKLDELIASKKICDYMFIIHHAEEDERKDHIHLWVKPNTLIDTMDLQNHFKELDPQNPTKPLKCIDFVSSNVDDWVLYCSHYEPYLATKGESRAYHYTIEDFFFYDEDTFEDRWNHAYKGSEWAKRHQILALLKDGTTNPLELIMCGAVPLNQATQLNAIEFMRKNYGHTVRGDHSGHENASDQEEVQDENI